MKQIIIPTEKPDTITLQELKSSGHPHKVVAYSTKDKVAVLVQEKGVATNAEARYGFRYLGGLFYNQDRLYFEAENVIEAIRRALKEENQTCFRREVFTFPSVPEFLEWAQHQLK